MPDAPLLEISRKFTKAEYHIHYHDRHELLFITDGECEMFIDGKPYLAKQGDIVLIGNLENHSTRILKMPYSRYVLTLHPVKFQSAMEDSRLVAMFKHRGVRFRHCLSTDGTDLPQLFDRMYTESQTPDSFSESIQLCCLKLILIQLFRAHTECFEHHIDPSTKIILDAEGFIDAHFSENIRIEELAEQFYLNKYYFSHSFKTISGLSPKQYLTSVRLNHAMHLLNRSTYSVTEIGAQCGFPDSSNFIRLFKSRFGMTPGEWRNKNNQHKTPVL